MPKHPIKNLGNFAHPSKAKKPKSAIAAPSMKPKGIRKAASYARPNHENNFERATKSPFGGQ